MYAANHRTVSCCVVGAKCVENERYRQGGVGAMISELKKA
jgi:hypothetical protein